MSDVLLLIHCESATSHLDKTSITFLQVFISACLEEISLQ